MRSEEVEAAAVKIFGSLLLVLSVCAGLSFAPLGVFGGGIRIGGTLGFVLANYLVDSLNLAGAVLATATATIISVYLVSSFTLAKMGAWLAGPLAWLRRRREAWRGWRESMRLRALQKSRAF